MLTVIGEALVDVVHSNDAPMHAYPGGSPLNVAVGAARLGHKTRFIGHYGTDEHGASIAAHLSASKVQVPFEPRAARTSTAQAYIGEDGAARYEFDIDWSLDSYADDILALAPSCEALHTGSIGACSNRAPMWLLKRSRQHAKALSSATTQTAAPPLLATVPSPRAGQKNLLRSRRW